MKKTLVALAALSAVSVFAQSSVTIFGTADAGLAIGNGSAANFIGLRNSGLASSALGFRGVEDLGGGMKASFHLEGTAQTDDGLGAGTSTNNQAVGAFVPATGANAPVTAGTQGFTFGRRAYVALGGGWGEVRLGREYAPHFWNYTFYDPFGTNGVGTTLALSGPTLQGVPAGHRATIVRASNAINYVGNFSGFGVNLMTYFGENTSAAVAPATNSDGSGSSVRLSYDAGPLSLGLGFGKTTVAATVVGAASDVGFTNLGASYNMGFMTLMGNWAKEAVNVNGTTNDRTGWTLGVAAPVGAGTVKASLSRSTANIAGNPNLQQFALGYVHGLSKRTQLYATVASMTAADGATPSLNGSGGAVNSSASGFDLGVRHSF